MPGRLARRDAPQPGQAWANAVRRSSQAVPQELLNQLADEVFELTTVVAALRSRTRKPDSEELSETEFLTLDLLDKHGTMNVGEIQREIGILPAQMSRLIRTLESKSLGPMVECRINDKDRRKIDVCLTEHGRGEHIAYRTARRATTIEFLKHLAPDDRQVFMRACRAFREQITKSLQNK